MKRHNLVLCGALIAVCFSVGLTFNAKNVPIKTNAEAAIDLSDLVKVTSSNAHEYVGQEVFMIAEDSSHNLHGFANGETNNVSSDFDKLSKVIIGRKTDSTLAIYYDTTDHYLSLDTSALHFGSSTRTLVTIGADGALSYVESETTYKLSYVSSKMKFSSIGTEYVYLFGHDLPTSNQHMYLTGSFASNYSNYDDVNGWSFNNLNYPVIVNSPYPTVFSFVKWDAEKGAGDQFKFVVSGAWNPQVGRGQLYGSAGDRDHGPFQSDGENCYTQLAGKYYVFITEENSNYKLIIDVIDGFNYGDHPNRITYYYTGTENSWDDGGLSAKPLTIGGDSQSFHFKLNEEFKLKYNTKGDWTTITVTPDNGDYYCYKFFQKLGNDNIKCLYEADYIVRVATINHETRIVIELDETFETTYVLDLFNIPLCAKQYAHFYYKDGETTKYSTLWNGVEMDAVSGRIYSYSHPEIMDKVNFNEGTGQTADLNVQAGKCFVLGGDWNGAGETVDLSWISLEAAQFIDNYMHFVDVSTSSTGTTANCASYYSLAKTAYNALSSNAVRLEVLSIGVVGSRLSAWATANLDTLDTASGAQLTARVTEYNQNSTTVVLVIVSAISLIALGSFFLLGKKKESK